EQWIRAVLREQKNNVMISETADGRYLRRHSDHMRRRHTEALDNPVEQEAVAAPEAGIERPESGDNEMTRDVTPIPDGAMSNKTHVTQPSPTVPYTDGTPTSVRTSERLRKAPDRLTL
ncbi:hypothetical protein LSAT2_030634, partial [Lamellibrachia satsuma]